MKNILTYTYISRFTPSLANTVFAIILAGISLMPTHASAGLILNGSFETGDFTNWTQSGDANVTSTASEGLFGVVFSFGNTPNDGVIYQDVTTEVGRLYDLSFDFTANGLPAKIVSLQVEAIGISSLLDQTLNTSPPFSFSSFGFSFIANDTTTRIRFTDQSTDTFALDAYLDNIVLATSVPEPSILAIFALGLAGLASRRLKKQS